MKIGISLPWHYLAEIYDRDKASETIYRDCSEAPDFLSTLKIKGCKSIELRHFGDDLTENDIIRAFNNITEAGLSFSIHGDIKKDHDSKGIYEAFPWLSAAVDGLEKSSQTELIVTIHPVKEIGGNTGILKSLSETILTQYCLEIEKHNLPIKIAYENQREKGFSDPALDFKLISESVTVVNRDELGTCWDMGHSYANFLKNNYDELPDAVFLTNAIHTHIHDLSDNTGATHWPLIYGNTPVEKYIKLLMSNGYKGSFNLELSTERFSSLDVNKSFLQSIDIIKGIVK